jgi:hypothetical protein
MRRAQVETAGQDGSVPYVNDYAAAQVINSFSGFFGTKVVNVEFAVTCSAATDGFTPYYLACRQTLKLFRVTEQVLLSCVLRSRVLIMAIMFYARLRMPAGLPSGG